MDGGPTYSEGKAGKESERDQREGARPCCAHFLTGTTRPPGTCYLKVTTPTSADAPLLREAFPASKPPCSKT